MPKAFTKQAAASAAVKRQQRAGNRERHPRQRLRASEARQQSLIRKPFADESVQRRQPGNRDGADQETERRHRHPADQPAHLLHVPRARRVQHGAGAQEQQALENGVVQRVVKPGDQRDGGQVGVAQRAKHQRRAEPDQDDSDVLDAVVRKQALEVMFHQRIEHAQQRREHSGHQHQHARPCRRRVEEIEEHQRHAVDAGLDHDARHQRRRCCWAPPDGPPAATRGSE